VDAIYTEKYLEVSSLTMALSTALQDLSVPCRWHKMGKASNCKQDWGLIIVAVLLPPLAVFLKIEDCTNRAMHQTNQIVGVTEDCTRLKYPRSCRGDMSTSLRSEIFVQMPCR